MSTEAAAELKRTPLHEVHRRLNARMVDFGGWDMPVEYSGIREEHRAVRERAGLFDVSHMGEFEVEGPQSLAFLQKLTCNDVARLAPGRAQYSGMLTERGTFIDDLLVYRLGESRFLMVVNASNTPKDLAHAREVARGFDAELRDATADWALLALQGPRAIGILSRLTDVELAPIPYYGFVEGEVSGASVLLSRTGYTGEDGFEIYGPPFDAPRLFREILDAGREEGILPCGLGARDTLRLEAKMALYGHELDETVTPWEADLAWIVKLDKGDFLGRGALAKQKETGISRKLSGFELTDRGIARQGYAVTSPSGAGVVTSGIPSPTLGKSIGLAYLPPADTTVGTDLTIDLRGRAARARVVPTPFYKRKREKGTP
jgi:aminomethyltransferase